MKFAQLFNGLLEEIYNYSDQDAKEHFVSLLGCTGEEALDVFRLYKIMIESGLEKCAYANYKAAIDNLRNKYGEI